MSVIVHVSDPHFGGEDEAALAAVADFVARTKPDVVVATGDLALNGEASELQAAFDWLRALPAPVVATPGNHDVPYYSLLHRVLDPFQRYRAAASGMKVEGWASDDCVIATANTARGVQWRWNWAQGAISEAQTAAVAARMAAQGAPGVLRVLATHHPLEWPNDAPIKGRTWGGRAAQRRLAGAHVDLFLSGHLHVTTARAVAGGAVAVCGGTLSRRQRHQPCGFAVIAQDGPTLDVTIMQVRSDIAEAAATRRFALGGAAPEAAGPRHRAEAHAPQG